MCLKNGLCYLFSNFLYCITDRDNLLFSTDWSVVLLSCALSDPIDLPWKSNLVWDTTCDFCPIQNVEVSFPAICTFWFSLHMRLDVEKASEQRLATFQKYYAKCPFIHSNFRVSVPGRTSSPPNHWRLRTSKAERGYRNWNYHCMIDFPIFLAQKNKNFEKADANFMQSWQKWSCMWWSGWWTTLEFWNCLKVFMQHLCLQAEW